MRRGKEIAQGAHASLKAILEHKNIKWHSMNEGDELVLLVHHGSALANWILGRFTKVCVRVDSEEELLQVHRDAEDAGLPCSLIKDAGLTEFNEPTFTAVAVGPAWEDKVNKITGNLKLY